MEDRAAVRPRELLVRFPMERSPMTPLHLQIQEARLVQQVEEMAEMEVGILTPLACIYFRRIWVYGTFKQWVEVKADKGAAAAALGDLLAAE